MAKLQNIEIIPDSFTTALSIEKHLKKNWSGEVLVYDVYNNIHLHSRKAQKIIFKNYGERPRFHSLLALVRLIRVTWFLFYYLSGKKNIGEIVAEGYPYALVAVILKSAKKCKSVTYVSGDWLAAEYHASIISKIVNQYFFSIVDLFICNRADKIMNIASEVEQQRNKFWSRKIPRQTLLKTDSFFVDRRVGYQPLSRQNEILFLGKVRQDSALDLVLSCLESESRLDKFALTLIGPSTPARDHLLKNFAELQSSGRLKIVGFLKRNEFSQHLSKFDCGLNLFSSAENYSEHTIQAKIIDYINHGLPVLTSPNTHAPTKEILISNGLGKVVSAEREELVDALIKTIEEREIYEKNFSSFFDQN